MRSDEYLACTLVRKSHGQRDSLEDLSIDGKYNIKINLTDIRCRSFDIIHRLNYGIESLASENKSVKNLRVINGTF
jgi:hypothetical protein